MLRLAVIMLLFKIEHFYDDPSEEFLGVTPISAGPWIENSPQTIPKN